MTTTIPLDTLRLYLGFWSVVYEGLAPPAARSVAVSVAASLPRVAASAVVGATTATVWTIDEDHANPLAAWKAMGSPAVPSKAQLASLIASSELHPRTVPVVAELARASDSDGATVEIKVALQVDMTPNSAVMVTFGTG